MPKNDVRIDFSFLVDRKRRRLGRLLGRARGPEGFLIDLWISVAISRPDGVLIDWDESDIESAAGWDGDPGQLVKALLEAGYLDKVMDDGKESGQVVFAIHDWEEHQPWVFNSPIRSRRSKVAARKRWEKSLVIQQDNAKPESEHMLNDAQSNASGMPPAYAPSPIPIPIPIPSPSLNNESSLNMRDTSPTVSDKKPTDKKDPGVSIVTNKIIELYNRILSPLGLSTAKVIPGGVLSKQISARWKEDQNRQDLGWWERYFESIKGFDWLMGRSASGWKADLIWLTGPKNMEKVLTRYQGGNRSGSLPERTRRNMAALETVKRQLEATNDKRAEGQVGGDGRSDSRAAG